MENENKGADSAVRRCAVCKIDLKGRLVYVDDQIEKLLGYSREELFGKLFLDFLDEPSQMIIEKLISQRNNYETFYDSTRIKLVTGDGDIVSATVVISLNFIAGNPVNYIMIITPDDSIVHESPKNEDSAYHVLLENVLADDNSFNMKGFLKVLKSLSKAQSVGLYIIHDNSLELRHVVDDENESFASISIPEAKTLHHQVAETGLVYDFTNPETYDVLGVTADYVPTEYVARIELGDNNQYVVRLIYNEKTLKVDTVEGIARCDLALRLAARLTKPYPPPQQDQSQDLNVRFTVGLLDALGIGALLTDIEGNVVGHNPTLHQMVEQQDIIGDFGRFASFLDNQSSDISIRDCFLDASDSTCNTRLHVILPNQISATLAVIRLGDGLEDLTSLVAVMPNEITVQQALTEG